jgi:hypothetical protein
MDTFVFWLAPIAVASHLRRICVLALVAGLLTGCGSSSTTNVTGPSNARCAIAVDGPMPVIESAGGTGRLNISINRECTWSARSEVDWIAISPTSGQGDAHIDYSVAANPLAASRTGVVVVNDQRAELRQAAACLYTLAPRQQPAQSSGERLTVTVSAAASCAWTAVSQSSWISVESGANGSGNGTVSLLVTPNTGAGRTGTVLIAGQPHTVSQSGADGTPGPTPTPPTCTIVLSSTAVTVDPAGGSASVSVTASDGCEWTASTTDEWLTIVNGASGTGNGHVQFTAAPNPSSVARTGTLMVSGQSVAVTQGGATPVPVPSCTFTLSSTSESVDASGGTISVSVTTQDSCKWTAAGNVGWLSVVAGASGTGSGIVQFSVAPNTETSPRTGTLRIAGQVLTVTQAGPPAPCTFTVAPTNVNAPAEGGSHSVTVTASDASCPWQAQSNAPWVEVTSASSGSGNAQVSFSVAANTDSVSRSGTLTIADQTVTVDQAPAQATTTVTGKVSGLLGVCPALTFVVDGRTVVTVAATEFNKHCDDLKNGRDVSVEGSVQIDGTILATLVRW